MKSHTRTHAEREAAQARDEQRRAEYARYALHTAIASIYDARRLTEADIDHMAELDTEARNHNRNDRVNYHE
jgi:hypothetical protein